MIDEDLRVWLIEINQNPSVSPYSEEHGVYMKSLVADLFEIVVNPVLNIEVKERKTKNNFEMVYSDKEGINCRREYKKMDLYPFEHLN